MIKDLIQKTKEIKLWAQNHPKQFYQYAMVLLVASFILVLIQNIFFPQKINFSVHVPDLYSKSDQTKLQMNKKEGEEGKIVKELEGFKIKRDTQDLTKQDSLRIDYLLNQYQKLKNEH